MTNNSSLINKGSFISVVDFSDYVVSKKFQEVISILDCSKVAGRLCFKFRDVRYKHLDKSIKKRIAFILSVCESANIFGGFAVIHSNNNDMTYVGFTNSILRLEEELKEWEEGGASDAFIILDVRRERGAAFQAYIEVFTK